MSNNLDNNKKSRAIMAITDEAAQQIKYLLSQREKPALGVRIKVKSGGCSGWSYVIEYADDAQQFEEIIDDKEVRVYIDPKAVMFLIGTTMDFVKEKFKEGFVFINPNEKGRCGCGESFYV